MLLPFFSFSRLAVFFIFSQTSETSSLRRQTHLIICNAERNDSLQQMSRGVTQPLASIAEVRRITRSSRVPSCTSNAAATTSSSSSSSQKSSYESSHWNERYEKESHEWMWTFTDEENGEIDSVSWLENVSKIYRWAPVRTAAAKAMVLLWTVCSRAVWGCTQAAFVLGAS